MQPLQNGHLTCKEVTTHCHRLRTTDLNELFHDSSMGEEFGLKIELFIKANIFFLHNKGHSHTDWSDRLCFEKNKVSANPSFRKRLI